MPRRDTAIIVRVRKDMTGTVTVKLSVLLGGSESTPRVWTVHPGAAAAPAVVEDLRSGVVALLDAVLDAYSAEQVQLF
jgi:hypothetical protein